MEATVGGWLAFWPCMRELALLISVALVGCGAGRPPGAEVVTQDVRSTNGMTTNGMTTNGMTTNGMTTNGMTTNGLSNGLPLTDPLGNGLAKNGFGASFATQAFRDWYAKSPGYSDMVMKYLTRCALDAGQTRSFTTV